LKECSLVRKKYSEEEAPLRVLRDEQAICHWPRNGLESHQTDLFSFKKRG
jgi:hypothetical protein